MPAVWETFESMRLHWYCSSGCEPGTVGELISEQPIDTLLEHVVFDGDIALQVQCIKSLACGIGIWRNAWKLAPTPVLILSRLQRLHKRCAFRCRRTRIEKRIELHRSLFHGVWFCGEQPAFSATDALLELFATTRQRIELDRAQCHCSRRERAVLGRRSVACISKSAVGGLIQRQVVEMRVG